jgi:hypothetical protein
VFIRPGEGLCRAVSQSQSYIATDGRSISKSWYRVPSGAHDQIFIIVWQLRSCFCGAPTLTRGRVSFVYAAGPRQRSLSRVRVPWISRPYFTVPVLRLPFLSPPTSRRVTVEVFDHASTRETWKSSNFKLLLYIFNNLATGAQLVLLQMFRFTRSNLVAACMDTALCWQEIAQISFLHYFLRENVSCLPTAGFANFPTLKTEAVCTSERSLNVCLDRRASHSMRKHFWRRVEMCPASRTHSPMYEIDSLFNVSIFRRKWNTGKLCSKLSTTLSNPSHLTGNYMNHVFNTKRRLQFCPHSVFMCFVPFSNKHINQLVFIREYLLWGWMFTHYLDDVINNNKYKYIYLTMFIYMQVYTDMNIIGPRHTKLFTAHPKCTRQT